MKINMLHFAPDGGEAGAGTGTREVFGEEGTQEVVEQPEVQEEPKPSEDDRIATITANAMAKLQQSQQQAQTPAKVYTKDELDKMFNVFNPTEELIARIQAGGADGVKAMSEYRDGLLKQSQTLFAYQMQEMKKELLAHVNPALSFASEMRASQEREAFYSANSDLEPFEKAVETIFQAMRSEGVRFPTIEAAYTALAGRARDLLGLAAPGVNPPVGTQQTPQRQQQQTLRPARTSNGSGVGGGTGSAPDPNAFQEIFG